MVEMCVKIDPYKCPICNQDMLFFTTSNNVLIDYKGLMDRSVNGIYSIRSYLGERHIKFIKCLVCNKTSIIDWSDTYPVPLADKEELKKFGV